MTKPPTLLEWLVAQILTDREGEFQPLAADGMGERLTKSSQSVGNVRGPATRRRICPASVAVQQ
jgi:hypothetical protein